MISDKLRFWQERLHDNEVEWENQRSMMDKREQLYKGMRKLKPMTRLDTGKCGEPRETPHVRNIVAEIIEAQVNSTIPQPKVTARRKEDEVLAKRIEDFIRSELNRMPMEEINDLQERIVPIQGGSFFLVEWDNTLRTHNTAGEITIEVRHPKQVVPQAGVYNSLEDMDYIFLKVPQTKEYIKRRYGVDMEDEAEEYPETKGLDTETVQDDLVTQIICYYRNAKGGIGLYSWANDTELEDLEDYQARRLRRCGNCGALEPMPGQKITVREEADRSAAVAAMASELAAQAMGGEMATMPLLEPQAKIVQWDQGDPCPYCGAEAWQDGEEEYEEIYTDIVTPHGNLIPGATAALDDAGMPYRKPTKIPFYKPMMYPLVLQRNVSLFGQLLGDSDVDKIADQQNTINRMELKMADRIIKSGTRITLPDRPDIRLDPEDGEKIFIGNPQDKAMIDVLQFEGDITPIMAYMSQVYEEARQTIGITDSFQGRQDSSASSGVAKQFAAAQSAGRLESKRVMKDSAYARLFEMIFKFALAYADEPRPIISKDQEGKSVYDQFSRYDFLEQDAAGDWYWNDQFLFSTDVSAPLANNRERMWQETLQLFQAGTFGDPTDLNSIIALWTKMELLHYPGAGDTLGYMKGRLEQQRQQQMQMMKQQQDMQAQALQAQRESQMIAAAQNQVDKEAALKEKALNAAAQQQSTGNLPMA